MSKIDLILPTRGRPERLAKMLQSVEDTCFSLDSVSAYIYVDADDHTTIEAMSMLLSKFAWIDFTVGERICLSKAWNEAYAKGDSPIVMHCGDDLYFTKQHWDSAVIEAFAEHGPFTLVYGPDGIQNELLATHSFTTREAADVRGYFLPPYFAALYNDTWLFDIYSRIGKTVYLRNVAIEHEHFSKYPEYMDETYSDRRNEKISEALKEWLGRAVQRVKDAKKMQAAMRGKHRE